VDTLKYILDKFGGKADDKLINLKISRWRGFPALLNELGLKKGVEIGTYKGKYAECLTREMPGLDLTCVDAWTAYKGYQDYETTDLEQTAYADAQARADRCGFKLMKAWSLDAVKEFANESLDFVFIDGNHDFRHVVDDVDEWSKKVRKGGIVSGHDFFINHHKRFGVREAIPAWCEANQIKPLFAVTHDHCPSWFYVKI